MDDLISAEMEDGSDNAMIDQPEGEPEDEQDGEPEGEREAKPPGIFPGFEGLSVAVEGEVRDENGKPVGSVYKGDWRKLVCLAVDDDGDVVDRYGNVKGRAGIFQSSQRGVSPGGRTQLTTSAVIGGLAASAVGPGVVQKSSPEALRRKRSREWPAHELGHHFHGRDRVTLPPRRYYSSDDSDLYLRRARSSSRSSPPRRHLVEGSRADLEAILSEHRPRRSRSRRRRTSVDIHYTDDPTVEPEPSAKIARDPERRNRRTAQAALSSAATTEIMESMRRRSRSRSRSMARESVRIVATYPGKVSWANLHETRRKKKEAMVEEDGRIEPRTLSRGRYELLKSRRSAPKLTGNVTNSYTFGENIGRADPDLKAENRLETNDEGKTDVYNDVPPPNGGSCDSGIESHAAPAQYDISQYEESYCDETPFIFSPAGSFYNPPQPQPWYQDQGQPCPGAHSVSNGHKGRSGGNGDPTTDDYATKQGPVELDLDYVLPFGGLRNSSTTSFDGFLADLESHVQTG